MSIQEQGIVGIFSYLDDFTGAIEKIKNRGDFADHELYSPTSYHEIEHACGYKPSPVRYFTLVGGLTGLCAGFALCLTTDWDWPLVVGGKTAGIYSLPAYVVIGFECTILLGAIATILGMLWMGRIPDPKTTIIDKRFTDAHFGIFVPGVGSESEQAKLLRECGAEEINLVAGDA